MKSKQCESQCPKCGSYDIEWGEEYCEGAAYVLNGTCADCGEWFNEIYGYKRTEYDYED